jgi:hypothetical protein
MADVGGEAIALLEVVWEWVYSQRLWLSEYGCGLVLFCAIATIN